MAGITVQKIERDILRVRLKSRCSSVYQSRERLTFYPLTRISVYLVLKLLINIIAECL